MGRSRRPFPRAWEVAFQRIANSGPSWPRLLSRRLSTSSLTAESNLDGLCGQTARGVRERRVSSFTPSTGHGASPISATKLAREALICCRLFPRRRLEEAETLIESDRLGTDAARSGEPSEPSGPTAKSAATAPRMFGGSGSHGQTAGFTLGEIKGILELDSSEEAEKRARACRREGEGAGREDRGPSTSTRYLRRPANERGQAGQGLSLIIASFEVS